VIDDDPYIFDQHHVIWYYSAIQLHFNFILELIIPQRQNGGTHRSDRI